MQFWNFLFRGRLTKQTSNSRRKTSRQRKNQFERLEARNLLCADLAELFPSIQGTIHFGDSQVSAHVDSPSLGQLVHDANQGLEHANIKGIENYLAHKPTKHSGKGDSSDDSVDTVLPGNISGYLPATLGNYSLQALSFTTLANGMPILNSLPSAPTSIFLDFDGDTTTGTQAYSEDADGTTFNTSEQNNIANAWKQISQYFSMFDTNVTTIESTTPKAWNAVGNNIVGGYSYVGVFPNTYPRSFNNSGDARTRVSGMAHELGHNFGLQHQSDYDLLGNKTAEYSSGFDSLHGPIMGVDYAQSVHKWFIGHGSNSASTLQDDMAAIANRIKTLGLTH